MLDFAGLALSTLRTRPVRGPVVREFFATRSDQRKEKIRSRSALPPQKKFSLTAYYCVLCSALLPPGASKMSASFCWEIVKPTRSKSFSCGTSSDVDALKKTFGDQITNKDIQMLRAMHRATRAEKSLWGEIADTLERLEGGNYEQPVVLKIWVEY